ncbi:hypothetical protein DAEQUDRAFT_754271 [Daedalea quercina L-15889]|uniref:Telomere-associated protein Rif1 N-terminal domain-containing protein n=1 Tax=Daedalea quercina L-15889 TaxID=1314783 RepID=A0A165TSA5_9APHY|nr:hypothetical protein DAEQUDRAFT_754271 [Daedalea quercina L-15889]
MSLPTPPSTSHREKENWVPRPLPNSRVSWSEEHQYHALPASPSSTPPSIAVKSSASRHAPGKSILKKTAYVLPLMDEEEQKECTPEPEDPLTDLSYIENPVARILDSDAPLYDLAEAYSVLSARLKAALITDSVVDSTWPLFQPLRRHRDAFLDAVIRDLGRVHIDPLEALSSESGPCSMRERERVIAPPTPKDSPRKKRGMSSEQAKLARDLCTICHAVIRFLNVVFTFPALHQLYTVQQLRFLLTHVLAIPMAPELPTINARKTCALAVWLIQTMQLPVEVVGPAAPRIAYAIRRGIEGELGREGKKGAVNDGLKAIYELTTAYPEIFVPAFTEILPSLLTNLLAPTLALRAQACHALGGFAYAAANIRPGPIHARIANIIANHLRPVDSPTPPPDANGEATSTSQKLPPRSPKRDAVIVRTLRTLLAATAPQHVAQGPVWAWMVIGYFVVLLGPTVYEDGAVCRTITALFNLGLRHGRSSVRNLGFMTWRCMVWAYFHAPSIKAPTDGDEETEEADEQERASSNSSPAVQLKSAWKVMVSIVDGGVGSAVIASLLSQPSADKLTLRRALGVLRAMSRKGGHTCKEALDVAMELLGVSDSHSSGETVETPMLLPHGLFCAEPGLLTADWFSLPSAARPILEQCLKTNNIRKLTVDELSTNWVFDTLFGVFRNGVNALKLTWGVDCPSELLAIWGGLIRTEGQELEDEANMEGLTEWAVTMTDVLTDLIDDSKLDVVKNSKGDHDSGFVPTSPVKGPRTRLMPTIERMNPALKLYLARELWHIHRSMFSGDALEKSSERLLEYLISREYVLVEDLDEPDGVRLQWAAICAEALFACDAALMEKFWSGRHPKGPQFGWIPEVRRLVWSTFIEKWRENLEPTWEMGVVILSAPFMDFAAFDMRNYDVELWNATFRDTVDKALDYGIDSVTVVDQIASTVSLHHSPTSSASSLHVADLLLSNLDINDARDVPKDVLELVSQTLSSAYPPEPRDKVMSIWLMRTLTRVLDACPVELSASMFELLQDGLAHWIGDKFRVFTLDEYAMDILPVYQTVLLGIQSLPASVECIETLAPIVESGFCGRPDKIEAATEAFAELWNTAYARMKEPGDGWSERLQTCLYALRGEKPPAVGGYDPDDLPPSSDFSEFNDDLFVPEADGAESEEEEGGTVSTSVLPVSPGFGPLIPALIPLPASPGPNPSRCITPPSTPKSAPVRLFTTPTRPHRPHARPEPSSPSSPLAFPDSPQTAERPRTPMTPKRASQATPRCTPLSSARRRGARDKENAEPLPVIATVVERIAMASPGHSVLGKRPPSGDTDDAPRTPKRQKLDLPSAPLLQAGLQLAREDAPPRTGVAFQDTPSTPKRQATLPKTPYPVRSPAVDLDSVLSLSSSPEIPMYSAKPLTSGPAKPSGVAFASAPSTPRRTVSLRKTPCPPSAADAEDDPFAWSAEASSSTLLASEPHPRKRKGVFMEAVEVPTFRQVLRAEERERRRLSLPRRAVSLATSQGSTSSVPTAVASTETQWASKVTKVELALDTGLGELLETPAKKRKSRGAVINGSAPRAGSPSMSATLRALRRAPILGSDDSILLATPSKLPPKEHSSDDDPRLGQVNPVGLVSPALRRVKAGTADSSDAPGSDDSVMSNSPSRDLVKRRIARLPSSVDRKKTLNPSPLKTRAVTVIDLTCLEDD